MMERKRFWKLERKAAVPAGPAPDREKPEKSMKSQAEFLREV
jgi:hypothetical protein